MIILYAALTLFVVLAVARILSPLWTYWIEVGRAKQRVRAAELRRHRMNGTPPWGRQ